MARWHRRILHREGPTGTAHNRTTERTAIEAAGLGIYDLGAIRRGLGAERVIVAPDPNEWLPAQKEPPSMKTKLFTRLTGALFAALLVFAADAPAKTVAVTDKVGDAPSKSLDIKSAKATKTDDEVTFTIVLAGRPRPHKLPVIDLDIDNNRDADWYLGHSGDGTFAAIFDYDDPTRKIAPATATVDGRTVTYTLKVRRIRNAHWRAATYGRGVAPGSTDQIPNVNYLKMPA